MASANKRQQSQPPQPPQPPPAPDEGTADQRIAESYRELKKRAWVAKTNAHDAMLTKRWAEAATAATEGWTPPVREAGGDLVT